MDANAGIRAQQKQQAAEKDAVFAQQGLQFFNKETQLARTQNRNVIGLSRDQSDAYAGALAAQGKGRKQLENAARKYFRSKGTVDEGGRSRRFGIANYQGLLAAQSEVDSIIDNVLGRNMAYAQEGAKRKFQAAQAKGREALGIPAAYGAPVMLSPTNRLGGALQMASQIGQIAGSIAALGPLGVGGAGGLASSATLGANATAMTGIGSGLATQTFLPYTIASDIRLKENIQQVGTSPQGYNIYEFNYKGGDVRFRGAMAQDVLHKKPMAVGIDQNYLTVDYRQIDVNMEVV